MKGFKPIIKMANGGLVPKLPSPKVPKPPSKLAGPKGPAGPRAASQKAPAAAKPVAFKKGGHVDEAADKMLIKKAVKMHDDQLHGGKKTNLAKLASGGSIDKKFGK